MSKQNNVAIVVPCFNEEGGLKHLIENLKTIRNDIKESINLDVILVNDGSTDNSQQVIENLATKHDFIFYRSFSKNAGHQSALRAGLDSCGKYDAVIMMDADMQHPPELIPRIIDEWKKGNLIVQMIRDDDPKKAGLIKYLTSRTYYSLLKRISSLSLEYGASDFRLIDKSVLKEVINSPEKDLFLRGYFSWLPVKKKSIPYTPAERFSGKTKYTFRKMLDLAKKGVLQFSEKPLKLAMNLGILMALISFAYTIFIVANYIEGGYVVSGWTSLMVTMLFCFGVNFILLGIIGRYLAHSISLQKERPDYVISKEKLPVIDLI